MPDEDEEEEEDAPYPLCESCGGETKKVVIEDEIHEKCMDCGWVNIG